MKKKQIFLKTIVAITLLSAMLVSALLGTSNAEYFKSFNKTLSLEMKPDLNLSYYLKHSLDHDDTYDVERGTYKNSSSFTQFISTPGESHFNNHTDNPYISPEVIYQVRIPVDETGYYTLDFTTYTLYGKPDEYEQYKKKEVYTVNATLAFGCEVLTATDLLNNVNGNTTYDTFASGEKWSMPYRIFDIDTNSRKYNKDNDKNYTQLLYSDTSIKEGGTGDSIYQWKSLCPSRIETVKLTFKVTDDDVKNGYVIWAWDLTGLQGTLNYTLHVENLSVNKIMNLDGTTATRDSNDPYFMFPQTALSNGSFYQNDKADTVAGYTHYSNGRGTYVTEATENSLGLRAEILHDQVNGSNADKRQNPLSLYIPLKNIEYDKTYKVTFDFSVAKQGSNAVALNQYHKIDYSTSNADWANYQDASSILRNDDHTSTLAGGGRACWSYLYSHVDKNEIVYRHTYAGHEGFIDRLQYANKAYQGEPLTKYDEVTKKIDGSYAHTSGWSTSTSVNDTYSKNILEQNTGAGRYKSESRNWFNAVEHTEYNGQNQINWLTFYNTTFSFNIDSSKNSDVDLDNLYWIWMIDFLKYTAFYNIRIDNVRIQEVVEYSSSLDRNGVLFSEDQKFKTHYANSYDQETDNVPASQVEDPSKWKKGIFVSFRGINGTGQNYQSKGAVLDEVVGTNKVFMSEGNIYAPIIDAKKITVAQEGEHAYQIALSGYAVCEGGIDRYVFSVDGGKTWHDMTLKGIDTDARKATDSNLTTAARGINQYVSGQTRYNTDTNPMTDAQKEMFTHIAFTEADAANGNFQGTVNSADRDPDPDMGWSLVADLSDFKHQANLDIIIAAVPESNHDLRCEILRIINYNQIRNYRTYTNTIISDVMVTDKTGSTVTELTAGYLGATESNASNDYIESKIGFTQGRGIRPNGNIDVAGGYSPRMTNSNAYEDIRTLFSDFPVKETLSLAGYALVEGGVDKYVWSVDGGKTWKDADGQGHIWDYYGSAATARKQSIIDQRNWWYDGAANAYSAELDSQFGNYNTSTKKYTDTISADLSDYEGEIVDVIFCAKPVGSDVYVPIARIDNVAVYGEYGTFYTRVHKVVIDGRTNEAPSGDQSITVPTQTYANSSGTNLNYLDKWNISYDKESYVIFEPQNVDAANSRYLFNDVKDIESAGRVTIDGYVMCKGGVSRYKFSLDGGETWTVINDTGTNMSASSATHSKMITDSKLSDSSFDPATDGKNGDFCCNGLTGGEDKYYPASATAANRKAFYDHALEFNIPALPQGAERDLLVVAEHDPDGNPKTDDGKEFPVLHMKIRVKNTKFGYQNITRNADLSKLNVQAGYYADTNTLTFNPEITNRTGGVHNTLNRITIPVTETGEHTLSFGHSIYNGPSTDSKTGRQLYNKDGANNTGKNSAGNTANTKADITLKANKTHYLEEEEIMVRVDISKTTDAAPGSLKVVLVSEDWLNNHGNQHAIYAATIQDTMTWEKDSNTNKWSASWSIDNIRSLAYANQGLQTDEQKLNAGKYKIMLIHRLNGGDYGLTVKPVDDKKTALPVRDFLHYKDLRDKFLLAEIPIYIHAADEKVDFSLVHDEGEYTYFSDVSRQLVAEDRPNVADIKTLTAEDVFGKKNVTNGTITNTLRLNIDVTEGDVRRGYIILDTNYTGLWAGNEHTHDECINKPIKEGYGTNWGEHESNTTCTDKTHKHYAGHEHSNNTCLSRQEGNPTHFNKQVKGDTLYKISQLYYVDGTEDKTNVLEEIKHTGIDYQVTFNLGANAFRKT